MNTIFIQDLSVLSPKKALTFLGSYYMATMDIISVDFPLYLEVGKFVILPALFKHFGLFWTDISEFGSAIIILKPRILYKDRTFQIELRWI